MHPLNNAIRCERWLDSQKQVHLNSNAMFNPTGKSAEWSCYSFFFFFFQNDKEQAVKKLFWQDYGISIASLGFVYQRVYQI